MFFVTFMYSLFYCEMDTGKTKISHLMCVFLLESTCRTGYKNFDESCFKFFNDKKTFDDARKVCQADEGDLIVVDNQFKQGR